MDVHESDEGRAGAHLPGRAPRSGMSVLTRVADVVVSGLTLVLTLPIIVVAALAIRLDSAGPAIIRHVRADRNGVPFELYRLRSAIDDGTELTRVGRVLRWSSVDELPQMCNVLRGDMRLVGPPPAVPAETAGGSSVGAVKRLRSVPGLTGTWIEADEARHQRDSDPWTGRGKPPACGGSDYRAG